MTRLISVGLSVVAFTTFASGLAGCADEPNTNTRTEVPAVKKLKPGDLKVVEFTKNELKPAGVSRKKIEISTMAQASAVKLFCPAAYKSHKVAQAFNGSHHWGNDKANISRLAYAYGAEESAAAAYKRFGSKRFSLCLLKLITRGIKHEWKSKRGISAKPTFTYRGTLKPVKVSSGNARIIKTSYSVSLPGYWAPDGSMYLGIVRRGRVVSYFNLFSITEQTGDQTAKRLLKSTWKRMGQIKQ